MRLEQITWVQAEAYFKKNDMVMISIGSVENHGQHLAMGTDNIVPARLTDLIEENLQGKMDLLIAPHIPYGVADYHRGFPGTMSLGTDLLKKVMNKLCEDLFAYGVRKFVFLNGHAGNTSVLTEVAVDLDTKGALAAIVDWWDCVGDINEKWPNGGHASGVETAAVMGINPNWVHMESCQPLIRHKLAENMPYVGMNKIEYKGVKFLVPRNYRKMVPNGWSGSDHPHTATAEWGREMLAAVASHVADFIMAFHKIEIE